MVANTATSPWGDTEFHFDKAMVTDYSCKKGKDRSSKVNIKRGFLVTYIFIKFIKLYKTKVLISAGLCFHAITQSTVGS